MFQRCRLLFFVLVVLGSNFAFAQNPSDNFTEPWRVQTIKDLMNHVKKSANPAIVLKSERKLQTMGIAPFQIENAILLDNQLLDRDLKVRLETSERLARTDNPARVVAIHNLRNLVAGEVNPHLKWIHAVTLSSIAPELGSALDVLRRYPDDPILRATLNLRNFTEPEIFELNDPARFTARTKTPIFTLMTRIPSDPVVENNKIQEYGPAVVFLGSGREPPPPFKKIPAPLSFDRQSQV